nr:RNA methyltransferase [uncultured Roseburia sp.]
MARMIEITDFDAPELDVYARLTENQLINRHEPEKGMFIAESPKVIERALDAGYMPVSILTEKRHIEGEGQKILARCGELPVYTAEFDVLTKLTGFQLTRGMLCAMYRQPLPSVQSVCKGAKRIAVLENVVNPTNVGAIFRSAAALGMDAVLLTTGCSNPFYRRAIRVSMGTVFQVPWTYLGEETKPETVRKPESEEGKEPGTGIEWNLELEGKADSGNWQNQLRELGFHTVAMALKEDSLSIDDPKLMNADKLAIVLGTEGDGLAPETIAACDDTVCIPMAHGVDSLNVAAASAVAFWQLGRQAYKEKEEK